MKIKTLIIIFLYSAVISAYGQKSRLYFATESFRQASKNLKPWLYNNHETSLPDGKSLQTGVKTVLSQNIFELKSKLNTLIHSKSDSILIIGLTPDDSLIVTGIWTCNVDILVFGNGKLRFNDANATVYGNIYSWGESAEITATNSILNLPQQYFYHRSIAALGGSKINFNNVTLDFSGLSHSFLAIDSAQVTFKDVLKKGFTTNSVSDKAIYNIENTNLAGEFVIEDSAKLQFKNAKTILLWHVIPEEGKFHFNFPEPGNVEQYHFHSSLPGIEKIDYQIDLEDCTDVMWAIMPNSNSNTKITDSKLRAVGLWFTSTDSINVKGFVNNSEYSQFNAPLNDRTLELENCSVQTWSLYPMKYSNIAVSSCILGEIGAQGSARVQTNSVFVDGSGGYMWGTDSTFTLAFLTPLTTSIRSQGEGIVMYAYSPLSMGAAMSVDNSTLIVLQCQLPDQPIACDKSSVWHINLVSPSMAATNSMVPITGYALIDLAPLSTHPDMDWYRLYYSFSDSDSLIAITPKLFTEKRNDTLGYWNTNGIPAGQYLLHLEVANKTQEPIIIKGVKSISLQAGANGLNENPEALFEIYPNPCNDFLIIKSNFQCATYRIMDSQGRKILSGAINESNQRIELSQLAPGTYSIELTNGKSIQSKKFILVP